jgi:tryptophanyl-tRNA synthetase
MSGIKPDGTFHLGNKMTADDMIFFQSLSKKARVFYAIADVEAYNDNGLSLQQSSKIAVQNVADILALGLDPDRAVVYRQSEEMRVMRLATIFSRGVTNNMLKAIYGERQIGLYLSALVQAGDILMPQLPEFGGPKPVIVPVGADQDPHIRLTRDLATKYHDDFGFTPPSAVYHRLERGLTGTGKMSKRDPASGFTLNDPPAEVSKKVLASFTGGRATIEEQRRLGGQPDICPVFDLYNFHFAADDDYAKRVHEECAGGIRMCGECKQEAAALVTKFLVEHGKKRTALMKDATELLAKSRRYLLLSGK